MCAEGAALSPQRALHLALSGSAGVTSLVLQLRSTAEPVMDWPTTYTESQWVLLSAAQRAPGNWNIVPEYNTRAMAQFVQCMECISKFFQQAPGCLLEGQRWKLKDLLALWQVLFCLGLFSLQLSVCLWWHDYR